MDTMETDIFFMREALALAREAAEADEVPVGAVIVYDGVIIAKARNRRESDKLAAFAADGDCPIAPSTSRLSPARCAAARSSTHACPALSSALTIRAAGSLARRSTSIP